MNRRRLQLSKTENGTVAFQKIMRIENFIEELQNYILQCEVFIGQFDANFSLSSDHDAKFSQFVTEVVDFLRDETTDLSPALRIASAYENGNDFIRGVSYNCVADVLGQLKALLPRVKRSPQLVKQTRKIEHDFIKTDMSRIIFISHSEKDKPIADLLDDLLCRGLGIHADDLFITSLDGQGIEGGEPVRESIRVALEKAAAVICLITPNYKASEPCLNELGAAWVLRKPIVALVSEPLIPGKSAFLVDVDSQLVLQNESRVSALSDFLSKVPGVKTSLKSDRWTARLKEFIQKLPNAISDCHFEVATGTFIPKSAKAETISHSDYTKSDYIIMLSEYLTRDGKREHTLHFQELDREMSFPEGTSKDIIHDAAQSCGYEIKDVSPNMVRLRKPVARLMRV
jgi:hypothetical protein